MVSRHRVPGLLAVALLTVASGCADTTLPLMEESFAAITTGSNHTCALTETGEALCWGRGYTGELGDGSLSVRWHAVRVRVPEPLESMTAGYYHTCGLGDSGTIYCWGWNPFGQVGVGAEPNVVADPTAVAPDSTFVAVAAGWYHSCGVTAGGGVLCWGRNRDGELGDGTTTDRALPVAAQMTVPAVAITAGGHHTCALDGAGQAHCWGRNTEGQLGDGSVERRLVPGPVLGAERFTMIDAGRGHTCGVTTADGISCWGSNGRGELGIRNPSEPGLPGATTPTPVARSQSYRSVSAGADYTCAVDAQGVGYCWGAGPHGQLGNALNGDRDLPTVVQTREFDEIAAGPGTHTCGIDTRKQASCWGTGMLGQLGLVETTYTPVPVTTDLREGS